MKKVDNIFNKICELNLIEIKYLLDKSKEKFGSFKMLKNVDSVKKKKKFDVELISIGENKIAAIRMIKEVMNLDLMKSKNIVDNLPKILLKETDKKNADIISKKFINIGCNCLIK
ncbi:ribosomal protein L7/L12 [Candidatus Vidania fulgoroideorum]